MKKGNPIVDSLALAALAGVAPLITFFALLMGLKWKALWAALGSVAVGLLVAVTAFDAAAIDVVLALAQGVSFGIFPVIYIIVAAVWVYDLTVASGRFEDLRLVFSKVGRGDMRVQAMLIGFAFGGLLEALAGFGAPIAIVAAMLYSIGMRPLKAALVTLVANAAPVAYGAMAIPVTTGSALAQLPAQEVAGLVGAQVSVLALVVPFVLCFIMDGWRGLRQVWPMALVLGVSFGGGQYLAANYFAYELTDVVACLLSLAAGLVLLRMWSPTTPDEQASRSSGQQSELRPVAVALALFPYVLIVAVFAVAKLWRLGVDVPSLLAGTDVVIDWPRLGTTFTLNWLSGPGTMLMLCGLITVAVLSVCDGGGDYQLGWRAGLAQLSGGILRMRMSYFTIAAVMGLAYVMNFSGQTAAIGALLASTGALFPLISPVLGWLGTSVTASATSSNALFAQMQATTAVQVGADPGLLVAANTSGATLGKMLAPQTAAIAAAATQMEGGESRILAAVVRYSLPLLAGMCLLVFLQSAVG
ncbi:L-lactate permease [Corynebacterium sp. zg-331]|uniref:L-lactate permease n=1 Tax=unclassified Corynebacterium TaxID=2624378 RepID=UPI00128E6BBE|nr:MULTISPECIES: L-lactate permease [unclassified Corynebacterium]MBC3186188.1 L-lactate permease [Corynebacterium sp. zg-331]MPV52676.1 L-lactate permease [Corynebacterium sp. zg331]